MTPLRQISKAARMECLMVLDAEQKFAYARRIRLWASMVLAWAVMQDYCESNVADQINPKTAFSRKKVKHFPYGCIAESLVVQKLSNTTSS